MRILHVTRLPITVTAFLMPLLREHRARGHRVAVACSDGPEISTIQAEGFGIHRFPLDRNVSPVNLAAALWELTRIVRRRQIDWVFTHTPIASGIARLASCIGGARGTIYMAHGLSCAPRISPLAWAFWYAVERCLGTITKGIITTNTYDYRLALQGPMVRRRDCIFRVNEVGVDVDRFDRLCAETDPATVKRELGLPPDQPMILLLAWTLPTKGIREFLEAARILIAAGVPGHFVIGGHGPLDREIAAFTERHNLRNRIHHLGWRRDAPRLMAACDIYTLPTYFPEGMPVSILEAMACAKPVVATRHRGCEDEVVDGSTGLLVEPQNPATLAQALRTFIENPQTALRFGQAGRDRARQAFRVDQSTRAIMAAFDHITGCASHASSNRPPCAARVSPPRPQQP